MQKCPRANSSATLDKKYVPSSSEKFCMSGKFPTLTDLLTASVAVLATALAAIPIYNYSLRRQILVPAFVWSPVWAMCIFCLSSRVVISDAIRTIIGAGFGVGSGLFTYWVSTYIFSEVESQCAISTLFLIPFALFVMSCHPLCKLPTSRLLSWDAALICMYSVGSFGGGESSELAWNLIFAFSYGSLCSVVCVVLFRPVFHAVEKERGLQFAISHFRSAHTGWFEGLAAYMTNPSVDHESDLSVRELEASVSLRGLLAEIKSLNRNPFCTVQEPQQLVDLNHSAVNVHAAMLALRGTITHNGYLEKSSRTLFASVREKLGQVRVSIVLTLRPAGHRAAHQRMGVQAKELFEALCSAYTTVGGHHNVVSSIPEDETDFGEKPLVTVFGEDEMNRMVYALVSLVSLADLVDVFATIAEKRVFKHNFLHSVSSHLNIIFSNLFSSNKYTKIAHVPYIWRAVAGQQMLVMMLIGFDLAQPDLSINAYFGWAEVGFFLCFLPTVGQGVIKGSRRFVGTVVASGIAAITAGASILDESAIFTQMLIIVFAGKLFSFHSYIQYAGIVFALAWLFECTPHIAASTDDSLMDVILYRQLCMCLGVGFNFVCSFFLFPVYSANGMRSTMGSLLVVVSDVVAESLERAVERPNTTQPTTHRSIHTLYRLHATYSDLAILCVESRAEEFITTRFANDKTDAFSIKRLNASESGFYRFANCAYSLAVTFSSKRLSEQGYSQFFTETNLQIIETLKNEMIDKFTLLADTIRQRKTHPATRASDCHSDWDKEVLKLSKALDAIAPTLNTADSVCLHVMIFELIEFLSSYDALMNSLNPGYKFSTLFSKSGIEKSSGVRFSIITSSTN